MICLKESVMKMKRIVRRIISLVVMVTILLGMIPFSAVANAEKEDEWIDVSLFYIYSNEVPDNLSRDEKDALFGPMGNGKSSTIVKVNLTKLEEMGYAKSTYGNSKRAIYSVENDNSNGVVEPKNEHNTKKALAPDSKVRVFWNDLYNCMDEESRKNVSEVYDDKFVGYVLKNVSYKGNNYHIDGIIDVDAIPTYQVEIYDKDNENEIAYVSSKEEEEKYSAVKGYIEDCLKKDSDSFLIDWKSEKEAVYIKDGKGYSLSVSQKTPAGAVIEADKVKYSRITRDYYIARYIIDSKELQTEYSVTVTDSEGNEIKTMNSGKVTNIGDANVPRMKDVRDAVEAYIAGEDDDCIFNWESREYIKDLNVYSFDTQYVSNTVSGPGLIVVNNTDEAGELFYEYSGEEDGLVKYKAVLKLDTQLKTTMRKVKLFVLKKEISNIEYGYDVANDKIKQRSESDFIPFGTAYVDDSYLQSLSKHPGSYLRGEVINEVLYDYDYASGGYTAKGELTDLNKIIKYVAFDTDAAKSLVDKINDNYNIFWYVIKDVKKDDWHIDGYLCKESNPGTSKIKVTVNHVIYDAENGDYVFLKDENGNDRTETKEVDANTMFTCQSIYPQRKSKDAKEITIDGRFDDWISFPEYWVSAEFNKEVTVNPSQKNSEADNLNNCSLVKLYNDTDKQMIYIYMKVSDKYDTYFRTDDFKLSVNGNDSSFGFRVGDSAGKTINGDISKMEPGVHALYIYDSQGNSIAGGMAEMVIGESHMNTAIEMSIPYDAVCEGQGTNYHVAGFEKVSGGIIDGNSSFYYDEDDILFNNIQLASEDTVVEYRYSADYNVESIQFGTITITGTPTKPYVLAGIGFVIALAGLGGVSLKRKKIAR